LIDRSNIAIRNEPRQLLTGGARVHAHPAIRTAMTRRTRRHPNQPGLPLQRYTSTSQTRKAIPIRGLLRERNAPTPQPRRIRDASGLDVRSAARRETGLFDLNDEVASEA